MIDQRRVFLNEMKLLIDMIQLSFQLLKNRLVLNQLGLQFRRLFDEIPLMNWRLVDEIDVQRSLVIGILCADSFVDVLTHN